MRSRVDHLVVGAEELASATAEMEARLGTPFDAGGTHPRMATHNRLLRLQEDRYLEVIASNPEATPERTRWFSLDAPETQARLAEGARPLCWVLAVEDVHAAKEICGYDPGPVLPMSRGDLRWQLTVPEDGRLVEGGVLPVLIEWPGGRNPAHRLTPSEVQLERLIVTHPDPKRIGRVLQTLGVPEEVSVAPGVPSVSFHLLTPGGTVVLESGPHEL